MGQIHAALVTDAKSKAELLRKQLTHINNYQTEGLLACICMSGTCDAGQVLQEIVSSPDGGGLAVIWDDLFSMQSQSCPLH